MTSTTTSLPSVFDADRTVFVVVPPLWGVSWVGTADHIGLMPGCRPQALGAITAWSEPSSGPSRSAAEEVVALRHRITARSGLTRQDVARALGVDRRSLSGFASGEIRPTEARLSALRALAEITDSLRVQHGARTREILRFELPEGAILDLVVEGRVDLATEIAAATAAVIGSRRVTITRRSHRPPLYLAAHERWSGRSDQPLRGGIARDSSTYEQDLSQASASTEPTDTTRPRRKQI